MELLWADTGVVIFQAKNHAKQGIKEVKSKLRHKVRPERLIPPQFLC